MSIQALADSLGISISTVSRALNGYTDVSAATRQRVFDAAKSMNYSPHPVAHRLATGKTGAVAILNSTRPDNAADGSAIALHAGMAEVLRENNYFVLSLGLPSDDLEIPELTRLLEGRLVDSLVLTRTRTNDPRVTLLQQRKIPFVTYGRTIDNAPHAWLDVDNESAFEMATQALIDLGHRRIALINGMPHMTFASLREQGFRQALQRAQINPSECPIHYTEITAQSGEHVAKQLLRLASPPSAILCANDTVALGAMAAVRAAGLQVGLDVSVMGFGNTEAGQYAWPALASIDNGVLGSGRQIAGLLLRLMAGEIAHDLQVLKPHNILLRDSVSACRAN